MHRSHRSAFCVVLIKVSPWIGFAEEKGLSNGVFVSYGPGASPAVRLLLKELVISEGANISAHLNVLCGFLVVPPPPSPLAPDLGLFGILGF